MAENLASKYRPKTLDDITEQGLVVDIIRNICSEDTISNRNFLFVGPSGCGKAQPLYSKVLTPSGYVNMGELCIGDEVFTGSGNVGRVSGIFPQGKRPIYQITLQDRTSIRVSDEHLNVVYRYNEDKKAREDYCLTTTELISLFETSRFKLRVDIPAVDWPEQDVPIHPYLLGALIGDGSLSDNFQFSNSEADVVAKLDSLLKDWGKYLRKVPGDNVDYDIASLPETKYPHHIEYKGVAYNTLESFAQALVGEGYPRFDDETLVRMGEGSDCLIYKTYPELRGKVRHALNTEHIRYFKQHVLKSELAKLGLLCKSIDKHIPREYLLNSREVRLELLRGLIDTDGYIDKSGTVTLTTCSGQLSDDIEFLVRSLGIRDTHVAYPAKYRKDDEVIYTGTTAHDHNLKIPNDMDFCSSIKHLSRKVRRQNEPMRNIIAIEYVGEEECQCIMIDHPDHTYISDGFIPTHNTTTARCIANILNEGKGEPIEMDAASHSGAADMREIVNQAMTYPVGMNYKIFIIDECFHKDTLVATNHGEVRISSVRKGDIVQGLGEDHRVLNVFKNKVSPLRLAIIHTNSRDILTTCDHLFMTDEGWLESKNLEKGCVIYGKSDEALHSMRQDVRELRIGLSTSLWERMWGDSPQTESDEIPSELHSDWLHERVSRMQEEILHSEISECYNVFREVWQYMEGAARPFGQATADLAKSQILIYLSDMWKAGMGEKERTEEILLSPMPRDGQASSICRTSEAAYRCLRDLWERVSSEVNWSPDMLAEVQEYSDWAYANGHSSARIVRMDAESQSNEQSGYGEEDVSHEREKWDIAHRTCYAWWKWFLHRASDATLSCSRGPVDIGVSCKDARSEAQRNGVSYELQSRPRTSRYSASDRGGWCRPQYEISQIARSKEDGMLGELRVEGIEVYQPGYNDQSFERYFSYSELHSEYVDMYDLEVEGHPSYFANGCLVHNCHSLSQQAWQAALKTLEEQPAKSLFLLCTTNPEKIPATILSRVQTFQLSKISLDGINNRLHYIIDQENAEGRGIKADDDAVLYISKMANGGMRDAITLLDKALAYSNEVSLTSIQQALGLPNYDTYFDLLNALVKKDNGKIIAIVNEVYNSGVNFVKWFENFFAFITNIVKYIYLQDINQTMIPATYQEKIKGYGAQHAALCLKICNRLAVLNGELRSSQYLQELAIYYLCTPSAKG